MATPLKSVKPKGLVLKQNFEGNFVLVIIFYPSIKTDVLDAQKNHLIKTVLLSIHNMFWLRNKNHFQVCTLI